MKKLLSFFIVVSCSTFAHAWNPPDYALTLDGNSRTVMLSTTPTSPTQLLQKGPATATYIYSTSMTFLTPVAFSTSNVFVSTATAFQIPQSSSTVVFTPDGPETPWAGSLWAVATGTTPFTVSIWKSK